jgi:hypothetical protein
MKATIAAMMVLIAPGCATSATQQGRSDKAESGELPIPTDLHDQIRRSCGIGRQLYVLDKAAAIGTDVLLEKVKDSQRQGLAGYLPFQEADDDGKLKRSFVVTFFTTDNPPRIAHEIRVAPQRQPTLQSYDPPKMASASFAALVRARQMAIAAMPPTDQPINPLLVPGEANGEKGVLVYLLAGTTKADLAVFGRHFRSLVPLTGISVTYMMPLSNTALELPTRGPDGQEPAALIVSQVVTDFPLETHVFTSLLIKKVVYVGTRRGVWRVDGDKIALVSYEPPKGME